MNNIEERNTNIWEFTKDGQMLAKVKVELIRSNDQHVYAIVDNFNKDSIIDCETDPTSMNNQKLADQPFLRSSSSDLGKDLNYSEEFSTQVSSENDHHKIIVSNDSHNIRNIEEQLTVVDNLVDKHITKDSQLGIASDNNSDVSPEEKPNLFENVPSTLASFKNDVFEMENQFVGENLKEKKECVLSKQSTHLNKEDNQSMNKKLIQMKMEKREKRYSCEFCEKRFASNHHLVKHNRIHTGEKPYKCGDCDFVFGRNDHLIRHKKTHSAEKPFKCDNCDGAFKRKDHLLRHSRTHSSEKKIACDVCNKLFKSKEDVNGHMKTHTRPYKCEKCEKSFAKKENIRAHMKTHEDPCIPQMKENMCVVCSRTFTRKSHVARHMKIHSGDKYQDLCANEGVNSDSGEATSVTASETNENHFNKEKALSNDPDIVVDVSNNSMDQMKNDNKM